MFCSLLIYSLCVVCCLLVDADWSLPAACCALYGVCCLLFALCVLFVALCSLFVVFLLSTRLRFVYYMRSCCLLLIAVCC